MTFRMFTGSSVLLRYSRWGQDYLDYWRFIGEPHGGGSHVRNAVKIGLPWCLDNGAFKNFNEEKFFRLLEKCQGLPGCKFVAVPDVVGNANETLIRFKKYRKTIADMGYPIALVGQDGLEQLSIPWNDFDCLFIGGTTEWKLSLRAAQLVYLAKSKQKYIHMGRVNSNKRVIYAKSIGCDSADGTGYCIDPSRFAEVMPALKSEQQILWSFNEW